MKRWWSDTLFKRLFMLMWVALVASHLVEMADAMESFVNLASAIFGLAMVTIAQRPAVDDHPYGHHKAEYFSSGFEGAVSVAAAAAFNKNLHRLILEI